MKKEDQHESNKKTKKRLKVKVIKVTHCTDSDSESEKQLAEEKRKNQKHPIMEYNWMQDIDAAGKPYCTMIPDVTINIFKSISGYPINSTTVEADPNDYIMFQNEDGKEQTIHAHADIWKYTIDKYIYMYYRLRELQAGREQRQFWERITFPEEISEKIIDHKNHCATNHKDSSREYPRQLGVDESLLQITANKGFTLFGSTFETPSIGKALYLNTYLQALYLPSNAGDDKLFSLTYDGLAFKRTTKSKEVYEVPPFQLEDYFLHEKISSISLAIELAAVIIETKEALKNDTLFHKVFEKFTQKALPTIVSSDLFFTRNTVARNFFQQIILDITSCSYLWNKEKTLSDRLLENWPQLIQHATSHIHTVVQNNDGFIYTPQRRRSRKDTAVEGCSETKQSDSNKVYGRLQIPVKYDLDLSYLHDDEIERLLKHLEELLAAVISPVNLPEYVKNPTHGLAVFCNPHHKHVDYFLDILSGGISTSPSYKKVSEEYKTFYDVRKAIDAAQKFISDYDCNSNKKIQYDINIPKEFWDTYNDLLEEEDGVLFLERSLLQETLAEQKNLSATVIKNRILSQKNIKAATNLNLFTEESIQIREYKEKSILYIKISKSQS